MPNQAHPTEPHPKPIRQPLAWDPAAGLGLCYPARAPPTGGRVVGRSPSARSSACLLACKIDRQMSNASPTEKSVRIYWVLRYSRLPSIMRAFYMHISHGVKIYSPSGCQIAARDGETAQFKNRDAATCMKTIRATPPDCPTARIASSEP